MNELQEWQWLREASGLLGPMRAGLQEMNSAAATDFARSFLYMGNKDMKEMQMSRESSQLLQELPAFKCALERPISVVEQQLAFLRSTHSLRAKCA